ncbi:MAG: hypothetical protein ACK5LN_05480, partial [Propioniciclava sp.]
MSMTSMGGPHGRRTGDLRLEESAQRRRNAEAPQIPQLRSRIVALFRPYQRRLVLTGLLVVLGAALGVIPPLLVQRIFDDALFPVDETSPDLGLLGSLVAVMIGLFLVSALLGVTQTWLTATVGNRV